MRYPVFPSLCDGRYAPVSIESIAREYIRKRTREKSQRVAWEEVLDPWIFDRILDEVHKSLGVTFSFGGWLEWRTFLRKTYLGRDKKLLHLGVDINAPIHTPVAVSRTCTVVDVINDLEVHGWGGRVTSCINDAHKGPIYLTYAHLKVDASITVGQQLQAGTRIGTLGSPKQNGEWFSHLHVQAWEEDAYQYYFQIFPYKADGYAALVDKEKFAEACPYPMQWVDL